MSYSTEAAIAAQNAATAAATLLATTGGLTTAAPESILETFEQIRLGIFEGTVRLAQETEVGQVAPRQYASGGAPRRASGGGGSVTEDGTTVFNSGKHAGKTIAQVQEEAPDYLDWCVDNLRNDFMRRRIAAFRAAV